MVQHKTYTTPRRPFEKERLDQELKLIGEYGLRNKREVWRVKYALAKIRKSARELLTLEEKDAKRLFEGTFLYSMIRILLKSEKMFKLTENNSLHPTCRMYMNIDLKLQYKLHGPNCINLYKIIWG